MNADAHDERLIEDRDGLGQSAVLNVRCAAEGVHRLRPGKCEVDLEAVRETLVGSHLHRVIPGIAQRRVHESDGRELRVRPQRLGDGSRSAGNLAKGSLFWKRPRRGRADGRKKSREIGRIIQAESIWLPGCELLR